MTDAMLNQSPAKLSKIFWRCSLGLFGSPTIVITADSYLSMMFCSWALAVCVAKHNAVKQQMEAYKVLMAHLVVSAHRAQ